MEDLDFQDHPYKDTGVTPSAPPEHTVEFSDFPPDATEDQEESQSKGGGQENKPAPSVFSLAFYQQFFDVDTSDVGQRLLASMIPNPKRNYLEHVIRPKPDIYGPFWVCATLTFSIAITGNVADFFATSGQDFTWKYNYGLVSLAATAIFGYWLIIPIIIWGVLRWRGSLAGYTLTELICIYGYSLAIFIPCSVLWLLPYPWVNYLLAAVCSLLSGATIIITLYPAVKNDSKQVMAIFMAIIVTLHALLATGFVMYFFRYTSVSADLGHDSANLTRYKSDTLPQQPVDLTTQQSKYSTKHVAVPSSPMENLPAKPDVPEAPAEHVSVQVTPDGPIREAYAKETATKPPTETKSDS